MQLPVLPNLTALIAITLCVACPYTACAAENILPGAPSHVTRAVLPADLPDKIETVTRTRHISLKAPAVGKAITDTGELNITSELTAAPVVGSTCRLRSY